MNNQSSIVAIYSTHTDAAAAVKELQASGIDMTGSVRWGRGHCSTTV